MKHKITIRRRMPDASLQTVTYRLEHIYSSGGDEEQARLLFDLEVQANAVAGGSSDGPAVRVWVQDDDE